MHWGSLPQTDKPIEEINKDVWENIERLINFVQENDLVVRNTMFKKNKNNLCTYKNKNHQQGEGHEGGPPWNTTKYGQIDFVIMEKRWKTQSMKHGRSRSVGSPRTIFR
eukprot:191496-Karenia_brevis.AAC.1